MKYHIFIEICGILLIIIGINILGYVLLTKNWFLLSYSIGFIISGLIILALGEIGGYLGEIRDHFKEQDSKKHN